MSRFWSTVQFIFLLLLTAEKLRLFCLMIKKTMAEMIIDNYIIVDVGANLTNKKFARDLDAVIQRAKDAGVSKIMVTGTSMQASKDALRLSRLYPGSLYATAGVHPHDAKSWDEEEDSMTLLKDLVRNPEVVAVGECGLDFNRNFSPPNVQLDVFEKQVCHSFFLTFDILKIGLQNSAMFENHQKSLQNQSL